MLFYSLKGALFFNEVQIYAFIFTKKGYCLVFLYEIKKKNIFLQSKTSSSGDPDSYREVDAEKLKWRNW